jgi:AcrR family transcriptional regulator
MVATEVKTRSRGRPDEGARGAVVAAATALFIQHDYADVSTDEILKRAGVSRGALYHHFPSKRDVFREVFDLSEARAVERIAQSLVGVEDPVELLIAAARSYLREAETSEELRRLGILQSRVVLGWEGWREVAGKYGLAVTRTLLAAAMDAGAITKRDLTTLSHVVLAALWEGATLIATADDRASARADAEAVVLDIVEGLRI